MATINDHSLYALQEIGRECSPHTIRRRQWHPCRESAGRVDWLYHINSEMRVIGNVVEMQRR